MMLLPSSQPSVKDIWYRELPLCFNEYNPKPLKLSVYRDLLHYYRYETRFSSKEMAQALEDYIHSIAYLRCLLAGSDRVDLWGKIVGKVTPRQAKQAKFLIQLLSKPAPLASSHRYLVSCAYSFTNL
jgi:sRNA-binding protein